MLLVEYYSGVGRVASTFAHRGMSAATFEVDHDCINQNALTPQGMVTMTRLFQKMKDYTHTAD